MKLLLLAPVLVLVAATVLWVLRRRRKRGDTIETAAEGRPVRPLLSNEDRWRDSWLPAPGGARRAVAVRCAFAGQLEKSPETGAWGCLDDNGVIAIVSPLGQNAGQRARAQSVGATTLERSLPRGKSDPELLVRAFEAADRGISSLGLPPSQGGASAVAVTVDGARVKTAHVGGDRVYRIRGGEVEQLTADHSIVAETFKTKSKRASLDELDAMPRQFTPSGVNRQAKFPGPLLKKAREALSSHGPSAGEFRSAFTRVLGSGKGRADVSEFEIGPDEWLVLVSCDVALALGEVKLRQILASKSATPQELAEQIVVAGYKERGAFTAAAVLGPAA